MRKAVCLDFDSTIANYETLDGFSKYLGKEEEIKILTNSAMNGNMGFRESIIKRIDLLMPFDKEDIKSFILCNIFASDLVEDCNDFIKLCRSKGYDVYIISGGFYEFISAYVIKGFLDIELDHIYCNEFLYDDEEKIVGIKNKDLSFNDGKVRVIKELRKNYDTLLMMGDGTTDLATQEYVDLFIGFGGVIERKNVREQSQIYCWDYKWLMKLIKLLE